MKFFLSLLIIGLFSTEKLDLFNSPLIVVNTHQPSDFFDLTKLLPKGYVRNGTVDYTSYLQKGLNSYSKVKFPNFPVQINATGLDLRSHSKVMFPPESKLLLKPTSKARYEILRIHNADNVELISPSIVGDRYNHLGKSGEWGTGISIYSSKNVIIRNANIKNCWGDGITISKFPTGTPPYNVNIYNPIITSCRRNGISIGSAIGLNIIKPIITEVSGTAPGAGIDIEPGNSSYHLDRINIDSPITSKSVYGILLALERGSGSKSKPINIEIKNHVDKGSAFGFRVAKFNPIYKNNKPLEGKIIVINPRWQNNRKKDLFIENTHDLIPNIYFQGEGFRINDLGKKIFHVKTKNNN